MTAQPEQETDRLAARVLTYLREQFDRSDIAYELPLTHLLGGFETSIYQFRLRGVPSELDRPLVLRLYPARFDPDQAVWESQVQNVLAEQGHPVARVHLVCTDPSVLGGAFFVMDFVPGALLTTLPPQNMFHILGQAHAALHKSDPEPVVAALVEQGSDADRLALVDEKGRPIGEEPTHFHNRGPSPLEGAADSSKSVVLTGLRTQRKGIGTPHR